MKAQSAAKDGKPHKRKAATPTFPRTDAGNAELFAFRNQHTLRFDHKRKLWLVWRQHWWEPDSEEFVYLLAKRTARWRLRKSADIEDVDKRRKEAGWAIQSESRQKLEAMLRLAQCEWPLSDPGEKWDLDPWLLGVRNGVINLRTGKLRAGQPDDRITKHAPVRFDPNARCPLWEQFLRQVFFDNTELIEWIQRALGYSLTGSTREECLFMLEGPGRNGKGTFIGTFMKVLGDDYAGTADFSTFVHTKAESSRPRDDVAHMQGKRFFSSQEPSERVRLQENLIKWLTGGDRIRARKLYVNSSEFDPTHKIWLAVNHKPRITGTEVAIWSRIRLIPFHASFDGERADKKLKEKLPEDLPGILAWAVRGCLAWQVNRNGLGDAPKVVKEATECYRTESDPLRDFLNDRCKVRSGANAPAGELWAAYLQWADEAKEEVPLDSQRAFAEALAQKGFRQDRLGHERTRVWVGLRLKAAYSQPPCVME